MNPSPRHSRSAARPCGTHPALAPALTMRSGPLPVADPHSAAPPGRPLPDLLPASLRECTFARLDRSRAPEAHWICQVYAELEQHQGRQSLLLYGRPGAGKSSLAAAILHETIAQSQDPQYARFWPVARSLQLIRESAGQRLELTDLLAQPLPILDQLAGPTSPCAARQLDELLLLLGVRRARIVVTTDLGIEELRQALHPVWVEELLRRCHLVWVGRQGRGRPCQPRHRHRPRPRRTNR